VLVNGVSSKGNYDKQEGVSYGDLTRQKLDIYYPREPQINAPVVVFFYGGSWRRGERDLYRFVGESLSQRGYIVVIPDYRLYPEVRYPGFIEDGATAIAWLLDHVTETRNGIVLAGHSAGAYIAAMLALNPRFLSAENVTLATIKGMIGLAGPYAFDPTRYRSTRSIFAGVESPDNVQPINYACLNTPPLLLLHGEADKVVSPQNSERLHRRVMECDGPSTYVALEGTGHFSIILALSDTFSSQAPVLEPVDTFLQTIAQQ
jgi:acetyl esterase/lipase